MNMTMARKCTNWILEEIDNGALDALTVLKLCLDYMSEDDVQDMVCAEDMGWPDDSILTLDGQEE